MVLVGTLAFLVRYVALARGGGWSGTGPYDDGVYFMSALNVLEGALPYRDFVLVHPPGIIVLLLPFAALAPWMGEPGAFHAARAAWMVLGAVSTMLCWAVLRPQGVWVALMGAVAYALFAPAITVEYTPMLEAAPNALLLVALLLCGLLRPDAHILTGRRALAAGLVLGVSPAIKIWGLAIVIAVVVGVAYRFGRRRATQFVGGSAASCAVVCLPFFLLAPSAMWAMVVRAQFGRPPSARPLMERLNGILGLSFWPDSTELDSVTVVALAVFLICLVACANRREFRPLVLLTLTSIAVILLAPTYFPAYSALPAVPFVLTLATGVGVLAEVLPRKRRLSDMLVLAVAAIPLILSAVPLATGRVVLGGHPFPSSWAAAAVAPVRGCVTSDLPLALIEMNVVGRNVQRACRLDTDLGGSLITAETALDRSTRSALILDYLRSGQVALPARPAIGQQLTAADRAEVESWSALDEREPYVLRIPQRT